MWFYIYQLIWINYNNYIIYYKINLRDIFPNYNKVVTSVGRLQFLHRPSWLDALRCRIIGLLRKVVHIKLQIQPLKPSCKSRIAVRNMYKMQSILLRDKLERRFSCSSMYVTAVVVPLLRDKKSLTHVGVLTNIVLWFLGVVAWVFTWVSIYFRYLSYFDLNCLFVWEVWFVLLNLSYGWRLTICVA